MTEPTTKPPETVREAFERLIASGKCPNFRPGNPASGKAIIIVGARPVPPRDPDGRPARSG
jgi:hypothetical protein